MAKKRRKTVVRPPSSDTEAPVKSSSLFSEHEDFLYRLFRKSDNEARANLSNTEWLVYIGILIVTLVTPFLYSRQTTENFLTPKEFFSKIAIVILAGIYCTRVFVAGRIKFARTSLDFPLAMFFGFCALSVVWNYNAPSAIRDLRGVFQILLLFPLIVNVVRSRWQVELLLWIVIFTGLATSTLGIMETYNLYFKIDPSGSISFVKDEVLAKIVDEKSFYLPLFPQLANDSYSMGSIVSTFGNRNYLGTFAMFTAFLPLAFFFYYRNAIMKGVSLFLYGWMLYGLMITRCRAALIGIVLGIIYMVIMLLINDRNWRLIKKNAIFFGAAVAIIFLALTSISVYTLKNLDTINILDKIQGTFTLDRAVSNTFERMWVWYGTIQSFRGSIGGWLFGNGFGSFKHFFPYQEAETFTDANQETFAAVTFRQAHNDWLQVISEVGLIGLALVLFLIWRFFNGIKTAIKREVWQEKRGEMNGDHILLIGIGAAMVAQLLASLPDFPFHRIETALYAVIFMALVPVLTETDFFKSPLVHRKVNIFEGVAYAFAFLALFAAGLSAYYEARCWVADTRVRKADMYMKYPQAEAQASAKTLLLEAIELDPLPGDPYLKLATIFENDEKDAEKALFYAEKAFQNINFNARSTYHSVVFRKLHVYYHLMQKLPEAYQMAELGLSLTCGDARSIYYMYGGKIALDISRYPLSGDQQTQMIEKAERYLSRAAKYPQFELQANASLAVIKAGLLKWQEALDLAASVSAKVQDRDPTMLNILGIAASNLGDQARAEVALKKALAMHPNNPVFMRDLGVVYVRMQRLDLARPYLEQLIFSGQTPSDIKQYAEDMIASVTAVEIGQAQSLLKNNQVTAAKPILERLMMARAVATETRQWASNLLVRMGLVRPEQPVVAPPIEIRPQNEVIDFKGNQENQN
jgi:O-antigen ligase/Tfp pilus assembly protein PilF